MKCKELWYFPYLIRTFSTFEHVADLILVKKYVTMKNRVIFLIIILYFAERAWLNCILFPNATKVPMEIACNKNDNSSTEIQMMFVLFYHDCCQSDAL